MSLGRATGVAGPLADAGPVPTDPSGAAGGGPWLAIDTATDGIGVAVQDDALRFEAYWRARRRHTELLAARVAAALAECGVTVADLAGVAVAIGPGSYTGLRVGLAFAKGLALATGVALVGVPTLDIVAAPLSPPFVPRTTRLWAVLSAGRGRLVAAPYPPRATDWPAPDGLAVCSAAQLEAVAGAGDWVAGEIEPALARRLAAAGCQVTPDRVSVRRAAWLAELGRSRAARATLVPLDALMPVYASPSSGR